MSWLSTEILSLSDSVDFLSLLAMYLPVFLVCMCVCFCVTVYVCVCLCHLCVCVCVFVSRCAPADKQTQQRDQRNSARTHTRVRAHSEITRTPLSCGGDECDADSLSLLIHTYTDTRVCMFVCLVFWVHLTAGCLTQIRSRFSYNHTYQHAYLCVCVCIYLFFFCLFC